jgi:hypothetical protein
MFTANMPGVNSKLDLAGKWKLQPVYFGMEFSADWMNIYIRIPVLFITGSSLVQNLCPSWYSASPDSNIVEFYVCSEFYV